MKLRALAPALLLAATPATATTIVPPKDLGALLAMSDVVVFADAYESWTEPGRTVPVTVTRFTPVRSIAGQHLPPSFEVEELGGEIGEIGFAVAGAPRYDEGRRYLLFLDHAPAGRWRSRVMAWGLLVEDSERRTLRPLPEAAGLGPVSRKGYESPSVYRRDALLDHLEAVALGEEWDARNLYDLQALWEAIHDDPVACQWMDTGGGIPFRYFGTLSIFATTPDQTDPVDGAAAVQAALAAWSNHTDSVINHSYLGTRAQSVHPGCPGMPGQVAVTLGDAIFNDPCDDIPPLAGCSGTLGIGGSQFTLATQLYDGEAWRDGTFPYVIVNAGAECLGQTGFNEMMTHELGHSFGFGHHTDSNATMFMTLNNDGRGASLASTDRACASYGYHTYRDARLNAFAWGHIEALENAQISQGCGNNNFCPGDIVRRQELAALLLRAGFPPYTPPACSQVFNDVTCANPFAAYIKDLSTKGITAGCGGGNYCPTDPVTREQLAKMLVLALAIPVGACGGSTGYSDVSCSDFGPWVKALRDQGVSNGLSFGCDGSANTLFCPKQAVSRAVLAIFLARALELTVPTVPP